MKDLTLIYKTLALFAGGGAGTILRYFVASRSNSIFGSGFPVGTTIVNLSGSFVIGLLWASIEFVNISPNMKMLVFVGFLGGYTTFSTFMIENLNLLRGSEIKGMLANILISNVFGILLVVAGFVMGRYFIDLVSA